MNVFYIKKLKKQKEVIENANIRYVMEVDPCGENDTSAYCLMQLSDDNENFSPRVILSKIGKSDAEFKEEYENLAKYFNAEINENKN